MTAVVQNYISDVSLWQIAGQQIWFPGGGYVLSVVLSLIIWVTEYSLHGLDLPTMPNWQSWKHATAQEKHSKPSWKNRCRNMMQLNKYKCQLQHLSRKITIAQLQDWEQMNKHQVYRKGAGDQSKSQTEHASTVSHCCEKSCSTETCINRTVISRT